ncbi:MAG: ATP-grasp domain-containing protein [Ignavibacteriae bacterium]|nr:ATP-grasp domain-containing protein [Ignavibacteriota bacterium]
MARKVHVAVIFNEPTTETNGVRKYVSQNGKIEEFATREQLLAGLSPESIDLSEVGVLEEREHVQRVLEGAGYNTSLFNMNGDIKRLIRFLELKKPDLIFNLCESVGNLAIHEMHVAGIYELMGVPYTGAGAFALGTCLQKARVKEILTAHKLLTPRSAMFQNIGELDGNHFDLNFPLIVKPSREDASIGIENDSVVDDMQALRKRVRYIFSEYEQPALVEEYIDGREINVGILGNKRAVALPISEIDFSGLPEDYPKIVTYNAKWMQGSPEFIGTVGVCPAKIPADVEKRAKEIALRAFKIIGLRDYARVDIRLTKNFTPYVIEVNPNPDISDDAGFARSARVYGLTFEDTVCKIVEHALERSR